MTAEGEHASQWPNRKARKYVFLTKVLMDTSRAFFFLHSYDTNFPQSSSVHRSGFYSRGSAVVFHSSQLTMLAMLTRISNAHVLCKFFFDYKMEHYLFATLLVNE